MLFELSDEERETQETYQNPHIVSINEQAGNTDYGLDEFLRFQQLQPHGLILDLGCGTGPHARFFDPPSYTYVGIDASNAMLQKAREYNPDSIFLRMRMETLAFRDKQFDGFWSFAALPHIPQSKIETVFREIARVTKPGGTGCLLMVEGEGTRMVEAEGARALVTGYGIDECSQLLEKNRLAVRTHEVGLCGELLYMVQVKACHMNCS